MDNDVKPAFHEWKAYWSAVGNASYYEVQMDRNGVSQGVVYSGATLSYSESGIGTRKFWVRACNAVGCSDWKGPVQ